jgi:acetyltransferase-like isoleucine patch superfamily enzyme
MRRELPYRLHMSAQPPVPRIVRLIWKIESWQGRRSLPVGRTLGSLLFYGHPLVRNTWDVVVQALLREPALRFRCERIGKGLRLYGGTPRIMGDGPIEIGDRVEIAAPCSLVVGFGLPTPARLEIGNDVRIGPHNVICTAVGLRIGNHCRTGPYVCIYDTDVHVRDAQLRRPDYGDFAAVESAPIVIEDDVWLGVGATVLKGVTIGTGAIIGAGAVVTDDIPARSIAVGNPARVIGSAIDRPPLPVEPSPPRPG